MAYSQKEPDPEAVEDDDRQYGRGPVSKEELDAK
jgi:DNA ligase-4